MRARPRNHVKPSESLNHPGRAAAGFRSPTDTRNVGLDCLEIVYQDLEEDISTRPVMSI